jgi:quercetin dioxygenase-like cupin family protein
VAIIHSKAGAVRSNHWHKTDWHYLFVLSGTMVYRWRYANQPRETEREIIVEPGQMVFTPEGVWHSTGFPVDTTLISMSRLGRSHTEHESDVVRDG